VVQSIYRTSICLKRMSKTTKESEYVFSVPQNRFRYRAFGLKRVILYRSHLFKIAFRVTLYKIQFLLGSLEVFE
jgi:hypothetical protein